MDWAWTVPAMKTRAVAVRSASVTWGGRVAWGSLAGSSSPVPTTAIMIAMKTISATNSPAPVMMGFARASFST